MGRHKHIRWSGALISGIGVGLLGGLLAHPGIDAALEQQGRLLERYGHRLLFDLRGEVPPPDVAAVVAIDERSAVGLSLPHKPREWPRYWHACLLDNLGRAGAALVVFDLLFDARETPDLPISESFGGRPACAQAEADLRSGQGHDVVLANAIQRWSGDDYPASRRMPVVLYEHIEQTLLNIKGVRIEQETLIRPTKPLAEAAVGTAPFVVPKGRVNRFWSFRRVAGSERATLPMIALEARSLGSLSHLMRLAKRERLEELTDLELEPGRPADSLEMIGHLRDRFRRDPALTRRTVELLDDELRRAKSKQEVAEIAALSALVKAYGRSGPNYLSFYGGAIRICSAPSSDSNSRWCSTSCAVKSNEPLDHRNTSKIVSRVSRASSSSIAPSLSRPVETARRDSGCAEASQSLRSRSTSGRGR